MITCKLCDTRLEKKHLRRDGSMLCPVCGQIYWKAAVERAYSSADDIRKRNHITAQYRKESLQSIERIKRVRMA